MTYVKKF